MGRLNYDTAPALGVPTASPNAVGNQVASTEFVQNVVPPGVVFPYAGPIPPTGWLLADGSPVSRTTYPRLFAAIGTTYGAGDGTTTFNLPDARGEFIRGLDNSRGVDAGRTLGSEQLDALQNMTGSIGSVYRGTNTEGIGVFSTADLTTRPFQPGTTANYVMNLTFDASIVARTSTETRPRNVAMNFIIKSQ